MKTFVVISDSHGRRGAIDRVRHLFAENNYVVHLGDGSTDMRPVLAEFPEKSYICRGNCDWTAYGEEEFVIETEGVKILCCHGHKYGVKSGLDRLAYRAKELECDAALYGHTHRARIDTLDGVLLINPGSLGAFSEASYCYLVVHNKKITPTLVSV